MWQAHSMRRIQPEFLLNFRSSAWATALGNCFISSRSSVSGITPHLSSGYRSPLTQQDSSVTRGRENNAWSCLATRVDASTCCTRGFSPWLRRRADKWPIHIYHRPYTYLSRIVHCHSPSPRTISHVPGSYDSISSTNPERQATQLGTHPGIRHSAQSSPSSHRLQPQLSIDQCQPQRSITETDCDFMGWFASCRRRHV